MSGIQAKNIIRYAVLPGVMPRLERLFASGFGYLAFLMAHIYSAVRLLPDHHPYLNPVNMGKFGLRHVIAEAANHLVIKKENIDQMIVFVALLAGVVLLFLQFFSLIFGYLIAPAMAQSVGSLFNTVNPERDIAFLLMDHVFGVPGVFCSAGGICTEIANTLPVPMHSALHSLLEFYSLGLLIVAVLIFLYFIVVVIAETAMSGTPFGQRFQNIWVPIRIVVALGLLIPINYGLNSAQYITLYAAKAGSSLATNGWVRFNTVISNSGVANPIGEEGLLAIPQRPDISHVVQFMSLVHGCAYADWRQNVLPQQGDMIGPRQLPPAASRIGPHLVKHPYPWLIDQQPHMEFTETTTYREAAEFFDYSDIIIRFGIRDEERFSTYKGYVEPTCGEIRVQLSSLANFDEGEQVGGADQVQQFYFDIVKSLWFGTLQVSSGAGDEKGAESSVPKPMDIAHRYVEISLPGDSIACDIAGGNPNLPGQGASNDSDVPAPCATQYPGAEAKQQIVVDFNVLLEQEVFAAWDKYNQNGIDMNMTQELQDRGWAGAGIWYNKIAQTNGAFVDAVSKTPIIAAYPLVMEQVRDDKRKNDSSISGVDMFKPQRSDGTPVEIKGDPNSAHALYDLLKYWTEEGANLTAQDKTVVANIFKDAMNLIFGTQGLFEMRGENAHIHPLAQLSSVGKAMVNSSIMNVAGATVSSFMGGTVGLVEPYTGKIAEAAGGFLSSTAFVGLTAGVILYYILPFLPFLYFYFAVASWIKSIFEAMVGVPLWALAHLRIDGEGLPGEAASNGYFLILEIFLRPILTVFGLLAAVIIFSAQVRVLNFTWDLVIDNLAGFEGDPGLLSIENEGANETPFDFYKYDLRRGIVDQFFFTIIYTVIVYMLATASFKLIDKIPDNILRWGGIGVSAFSDTQQDPTEGLTQYAAIGGISIGQQITGGIQKVAQEGGETMKGQFQRGHGQVGSLFENLMGQGRKPPG